MYSDGLVVGLAGRRGRPLCASSAPISGSVLAGPSDSISGPGSMIASCRRVAVSPSERENNKTRERRRDFGEDKERKREGKKENKEDEGGRLQW